MYMNTINISDFRYNLKLCFDKALSGEKVCIERGGVVYTLKTEGITLRTINKVNEGVSPISDKQPTVVSPTNIKPTIKRPDVPFIPGLTTADKIQTNGLCKIHGQALDSRQRCMQKGCKYA
jgi:hypothetical protein